MPSGDEVAKVSPETAAILQALVRFGSRDRLEFLS